MRKLLLIVALAVGMTAAAQQEKEELFQTLGVVIETEKDETGHMYTVQVEDYMLEYVRMNINLWVDVNDGVVTSSWRLLKDCYVMVAEVGGYRYYFAFKSNYVVIKIIG